jgi:hypothetical protein
MLPTLAKGVQDDGRADRTELPLPEVEPAASAHWGAPGSHGGLRVLARGPHPHAPQPPGLSRPGWAGRYAVHRGGSPWRLREQWARLRAQSRLLRRAGHGGREPGARIGSPAGVAASLPSGRDDKSQSGKAAKERRSSVHVLYVGALSTSNRHPLVVEALWRGGGEGPSNRMEISLIFAVGRPAEEHPTAFSFRSKLAARAEDPLGPASQVKVPVVGALCSGSFLKMGALPETRPDTPAPNGKGRRGISGEDGRHGHGGERE